VLAHNYVVRDLLRNALIVLVLAGVHPFANAADYRMRVYPNPTIRIFAITAGPDGFLWLAASDGLYRFDGFRYEKIREFPLSSARFLATTNDGSLWAGDFQGLVRLHSGRFETILSEYISGLAGFEDHVFVETNTRFLRIGVDNSKTILSYRVRRELNADADGQIWSICMNPIAVCWLDPKNPAQPHIAPSGPEFTAGNDYQSARDSLGRIWVADNTRAVMLSRGNAPQVLNRLGSTEGNRAGPLLSGRGGHVWFLGQALREVASGFEFRDRADHDRFAPLAGFEDASGHLWISSAGQGLVEWIGDKWERWFPEDLAGEPAVQMVRARDGALFVATHKNIYREDGARWKPLAGEPHRYEALAAMDTGDFLASIRDYGVVRLSSDGIIRERIPDPQPGRNQYRKILRDSKGRYWVGAKEKLLRIEGQPGALHFVPQSLPGLQSSEMQHAVDLQVDAAGRLWVGYAAGIAWLDGDDHWHRIETSEPVTAVRSISVDADHIWVAYRRPGTFSELTKEGERWRVTQFSSPTRDTYFLKRDSRGWIWRGTPNGVYIADGVHFENDAWLHLHMGNGLAANELDMYGFFEDRDGSVWISGEQGITHLYPQPSWFAGPAGAPPIRVTHVQADDRDFSFPANPPAEFPKGTKVLRIDLGSLGASPFRDNPLRWRLRPSQEWHPSSDGSLEFRDLAGGHYSLQVAYAGGPALDTYAFQIGPAVEWISWWWCLPTAAMVPFALRRRTVAKLRYRFEKSAFLLRRRLHATQADSVLNDWCGKILNGRYRVERVLSRGGFSIVYEAVDSSADDSRIAVKVCSRTGSKDGWIRNRFAHEVASLRSIHHPGVVPILDSWISPLGEPCLAMPLVQGDTLRNLIPMPAALASPLIRKIGDALGYVHTLGIVHRDLKPENIIVTAGNQPVVVDFGSSGLRSAEDELAETTLIAGSFHYMAPERLTGRYSPATDVYSFAVIMLEMLKGKRLSDLRSSFSDPSFEAELSSVVGNQEAASLLAPAFDPDPRGRPASVSEWAERIASALDQASRPS
jgi:ligand-binding sensor domain-containing protein